MTRSATAAPTRTIATSRTMPMLPPRWLRSTDIREASLKSCVAMPPLAQVPSDSLLPPPSECPSGRFGASSSNAYPVGSTSARESATQPHHVADHFGHRLVVLGRNLAVDLHGGMQGARQRRI